MTKQMEQGSVTITRERRCDGCAYYEQINLHVGECHRHAPMACYGFEVTCWPEVDADEWCGEWKDKA